MKNKMNKHLKNLAQQIVEAEKELQLGNNVKENEDKIESIMCSLPIEDIIKLDMYISEKKLLTK